MEPVMTLDLPYDIYGVDNPINFADLNNKLFCTFTTLDDVEELGRRSALNELIKKLNGGVVDTRFQIDWNHYKNTILLTQQNELRQLKTKIYEIIEL
jgi:hypothetical protein